MTMKALKNRNNKGFTLVEVVVALALFSVLISFLFPSILGSIRMNQASDNLVVVQDEGQSFLEELVSLSKNQKDKDELIAYYESAYGTKAQYSSQQDVLKVERNNVKFEIQFLSEGNRIRFKAVTIKEPVQTFEAIEWLVYKS